MHEEKKGILETRRLNRLQIIYNALLTFKSGNGTLRLALGGYEC